MVATFLNDAFQMAFQMVSQWPKEDVIQKTTSVGFRCFTTIVACLQILFK
jgi:hypothetical protein